MPEPLNELSEEGLLAADRHQKRIMDGGDQQALAELLHPNFIINAPHNICGARETVLRLSQGDALRYENCRRQVERTSLTGSVGIVMGNEMVTPAEGSLLAAWFGKGTVRRRFTDVYVFEDGKWLLLARQGSVVREAKRFDA